jgi:hypothetical protein
MYVPASCVCSVYMAQLAVGGVHTLVDSHDFQRDVPTGWKLVGLSYSIVGVKEGKSDFGWSSSLKVIDSMQHTINAVSH